MNIHVAEIWQEVKALLTGKTLDTIVLPLIFAITNAVFGLIPAAWITLGVSLALVSLRLIQKRPWAYTLGGMALVGIAIVLTLLTQNALNYFLPALVTSALLAVASLVSNLIGKPIAAWASHLTRGWPLDWFWREDILPAYREVTWAWMVFFLIRLGLQLLLFLRGQTGTLIWTEALLGWPVTLSVLVASYIYGIWRLRQLGGPGVDEFLKDSPPPWQGQTRGF